MQARTDENGKHGFLNKLPTGMSFIPTTNCSSEASAPSTHTQSTSSTVISPSSFDVSEALCESSAQSGSTSSLKEQDYIGMAVMSSSSIKEKKSLRQLKLDLEEPDLRLGLGPSPAKGVCADNVGLHLFPQLNRKEGPCLSHTQIDAPVSTNVAGDIAPTHPHSSRTYAEAGSLKKESTYAQIDAPASMSVILDVAHAHPHSSGSYPVPSSLKRVNAMPFHSAFLPPTADPHFKSSKRSFSDTILPSTPNVGSPAYVKPEEVKTAAMFATGALRMIMPRPDIDSKSQSQNLCWGNPTSSSWQSESQNMSSLGQLPRKHSDNPLPMKSLLEQPLSASDSALASNREIISDDDEAPPSKEQVVGWPPVRSYRRSAINSGRSRPAGIESDGQAAAIFVKVNMDGIPIGRKVDLNAYRNYDELLSALEGMFYSPPVGEGVRFLHARDFVLTYEDKEGDWMLVGDVPWGMFVNTVKRLRITRGSDSACLGSSTSKNFT